MLHDGVFILPPVPGEFDRWQRPLVIRQRRMSLQPRHGYPHSSSSSNKPVNGKHNGSCNKKCGKPMGLKSTTGGTGAATWVGASAGRGTKATAATFAGGGSYYTCNMAITSDKSLHVVQAGNHHTNRVESCLSHSENMH